MIVYKFLEYSETFLWPVSQWMHDIILIYGRVQMNDLLQSSSFMPYFTLENNWLWSFKYALTQFTPLSIPLPQFLAHVQIGNFSISKAKLLLETTLLIIDFTYPK